MDFKTTRLNCCFWGEWWCWESNLSFHTNLHPQFFIHLFILKQTSTKLLSFLGLILFCGNSTSAYQAAVTSWSHLN